jgi:hypothetical protein
VKGKIIIAKDKMFDFEFLLYSTLVSLPYRPALQLGHSIHPEIFFGNSVCLARSGRGARAL